MMYQGAIVATMDWLYPLSGFVVGAIVGLTGMGGGSLMTPLLILLFGVHPLTAVGTDLLYAAVTKTAGTAIHFNEKPSPRAEGATDYLYPTRSFA